LSTLRRRGAAVHRLSPAQLSGGTLRNRVRAALRSGALVEIGPGTGTGRVLDSVAAESGARSPVRAIRSTSAGGAIAFVRLASGPAVLRIAGAGWPGDPRPGAEALRALEGLRFVPRSLGSGDIAGAAWSLETQIPGARPRRLDGAIGRAACALAAGLPRNDGRAESLGRDLDVAGIHLPSRSSRLEAVAATFRSMTAAIAPIGRHGDLWLGNLLSRAGEISGVVDWDAWDPAGVPGADVLHLYGTDLALRQGRELGDIWLTRPWRSERFASFAAPYWAAMGGPPAHDALELAAVAWWAAAIAGTLARVPHRSRDERWVSTNVDRVVEAILR
jgi:hypothetical protein